MRVGRWTMVAVAAMLAAACGGESATTGCCDVGDPSLRVINGFTSPVDVVIDGRVAIASLAPAAIATAAPTTGAHTVELRPTGAGTAASRSISIAAGTVRTIAAVRATAGGVASVALDDTNSVVPANATKVRVLHLAPNAGTLQVFRTQPDWAQPVAWQFPFTYQAEPTSLSAPFYQSTVGTWEVRIWQTPADASGWSNASVRVTLPLQSGEKRTVVLLDDGHGGVKAQIL